MINFDLGKTITFAVDMEKLMSFENVRIHAQEIGIKNILKDSHASCVRADFETEVMWIEASRVKAGEKLTALMSGDVRMRSAIAGPSAFEKLMVQIAFKLLSKEKRKELAALDDKGAAFIDAVIEKNRELIETKARAEMARRKAEDEANAALSDTLDLDLDI